MVQSVDQPDGRPVRATRDLDRARDRRILALAIPALGSLAVEPLYTLADTAIVSRLGTAPLGGLALAVTVLGTGFWIFHFLQEGTTTEVAQRWGAGDRRQVADATFQALWLSVCVGLAVAALLAVWGPAVTHLLGGRGRVQEAASTYLRISAVGVPFLFVSLVGHGFLRGVEAVRATVPVVVVANVINVVLELLFVNVWHTGVAGSAWGTVVAQVIACGWLMVLLVRHLGGAGAGVSRAPRPVEWGRLIQVGGWMFVRTGLLISMFALATNAAARKGDDVLAGHQIAYQVFILLALSTDALAVSAQTLTGTLLGAGDLQELRALMTRLWRMTWIAGAGLSVMVAALAVPVARLLAPDGASAHIATIAIIGVAVMQLPAGAAFLTDGELMGASDFRYLAVAMVISAAVYLPLWGVVIARPGLGISAIWASLVVLMLVRGVLGWRRSHQRLHPVSSPA